MFNLVKYRCFGLILLIGLAHAGQAQLNYGLSVGYRGGLMKSKSFDQFKTGYNEYYKNELESGFNGFNFGYGYAANFDMTFGHFVMGMRYANYFAKDEARFQHGGKRIIQMQESLFATAIGFGGQGEMAYLHITAAMLFGGNRLRSSYEYADGTRSSGNESSLNGYYRALRLGYSLRAETGIKPFYLGVEYVFGTVAGTGSDLSETFAQTYIPQDYKTWANGSLYTGDNVQPDWSGIRIECGLRWFIGD